VRAHAFTTMLAPSPVRDTNVAARRGIPDDGRGKFPSPIPKKNLRAKWRLGPFCASHWMQEVTPAQGGAEPKGGSALTKVIYPSPHGTNPGISPTAPTMLTTIGPLIGIGLPVGEAGMCIVPEATRVPAVQVTNPANRGD
jgi:hypothetical protein